MSKLFTDKMLNEVFIFDKPYVVKPFSTIKIFPKIDIKQSIRKRSFR